MRALVTGVTGQDGRYLTHLLLQEGYEVYGLVRRAIRAINLPEDLRIVTGDVTDPSIQRIILEIRPTEIYNLAAMSHVGQSFISPAHTFEVNALGCLNMLEIARKLGCKFYQASTSEMFGGMDPPQTEQSTFHPRSPYGVAKLAAYWATVNYREAYNLFAVNGILFNHESPLRGDDFVTQKVAKFCARVKTNILLGREPAAGKLKLGNLKAKRDWGHAKDFVRGMFLMMQHFKPNDYVLATGEMRSIEDLLDIAFGYIGIKDWQPYIEIDPTLFRPADVDSLEGDATKAEIALGWRPKIHFDDMIAEMIEAEVDRLSGWEWEIE